MQDGPLGTGRCGRQRTRRVQEIAPGGVGDVFLASTQAPPPPPANLLPGPPSPLLMQIFQVSCGAPLVKSKTALFLSQRSSKIRVIAIRLAANPRLWVARRILSVAPRICQGAVAPTTWYFTLSKAIPLLWMH